MDMNDVRLVGRLAGDPILKSYTKKDGSEGFRCFFRVAVTQLMDRGQKDPAQRRTNYIAVVTWGEAAKRHAQYLAKGTEVAIGGELICQSVKQEDGSFREYTSVEARDVQYGRRSLKNSTAADVAAQVSALQKRILELAQGGAPAAAAPETDDEPAVNETTDTANPFGSDEN